MATMEQWNLKLVNAEKGYALLPRLPNSDIVDWGGVEVAHIDTGVRRHDAFAPWANGTSDTVRLNDGKNYIESGKLPLDPMDYRQKYTHEMNVSPGHGTRTASVICGHDFGKFKGVAPGVPVVPYRAVNGFILTTERLKPVAKALSHAVLCNRCEIVSISLGNVGIMSPVRDALRIAYDHGVIVVAAGGHWYNRVVYPARYPRSISVGGVREDCKVWHRYFRHGGNEEDSHNIDVWAPADNQRVGTSTRIGDRAEAEFQHDYCESNGTSYATAHVAAAAAMWLVYRRETLDKRYKKPWQRIEAFRALLKATGSEIKGKYPRKKKTKILDIEELLNTDLPRASDLKSR